MHGEILHGGKDLLSAQYPSGNHNQVLGLDFFKHHYQEHGEGMECSLLRGTFTSWRDGSVQAS